MNKIVIICLKYPPVYSGYGNQAKATLEKILKETQSFKITVLTGAFSKSDRTINNNNMKVKEMGSRKIFEFSEKLGSVIYGICSFFWLLKKAKHFSVIHCISAHGPSVIPAVIAGKLLNKKVILKVTQSEFRPTLEKINFVHNFVRKLRQKIALKADVIVSISTEIEKDLLKHGARKEQIVHVPNGVNSKIFHPVSLENKRNLRKEVGLDPNQLVLIYSGALNKRKGVVDLLEVVKTLPNSFKDKVIILICGPDHENIHNNFIKDKIFPIEVRYEGEVNNIYKYYQLADIFIFASYSEGLPNSLLEASMSGLPAVTSHVGGNTDIIINEHNGFVFNLGKQEEFREKLMTLITNEKLRENMTENTLKLTRENFSLEKVASEYMKLYSEA